MPETLCRNHLQSKEHASRVFQGRRQRHHKVTCFVPDPDRARHLSPAPSPAPDRDPAPGVLRGRDCYCPALALSSALVVDAVQVLVVDAVEAPAVPVAFDPGLPALSAEQGLVPGLPAGHLPRFSAEAADEHPVGMVQAARHAGCPGAFGFPAEESSADPADALPADPAARGRGPSGQATPVRAAEPAHPAAGNGSSRCEYCVAAPPDGDSDPRHTGADRLAAALAPAQNRGSTCPIRSAAAPSHCPSDRPSVAAHPACQPRKYAGGAR